MKKLFEVAKKKTNVFNWFDVGFEFLGGTFEF